MCKKIVEKYNSLPDDELIGLVRENNEEAFEALFNRYIPTLKYIISKNTVLGSDFEDMLQDATISFYYAVQMFDFRSASFPTFLSVCVERSLRSTIKKAAAQKRIPRELIVSIDDSPAGDAVTESAEEAFFGRADSIDRSDEIRTILSDLEFKVLRSFLETESYEKTASDLGVSRKTVDNALVRIRKKLNQ